MAKINKALDLNKLFLEHKKGKLLKKFLRFPVYAGPKYDGNYTIVRVESFGNTQFISSGGHTYDNNNPTFFEWLPRGVYIAERIANDGKLGDRRYCALTGPRGMQTAKNHKYMVHDYLTLDEYDKGSADENYVHRRARLREICGDYWIADHLVHTQAELDIYLELITKKGFEGLMIKDPAWIWKDTKSRKPELSKYKRRPTVDLLVIGVNEGTGKYEGMIGSLTLTDSKGRQVDVGSGMSDEDRAGLHTYYIGKVVEVFYEQIMDTYIQPTFGDEYEGVLIREDKTKEDID